MREQSIFNDQQLTCMDCGATFIFTAGEQQFYSSHYFDTPKRCKACREKRKQDKQKARQKEKRRIFEDRLKIYSVLSVEGIHPTAPLYIIGNGFDIMHGVPSSYRDFEKTLGKRNELRSVLETYLNVDSIWADFEEALGHLNYSMMLNDDVLDMFLDVCGAYDPDSQAADYFVAVDSVTMPAASITDKLPRRFRQWIETLKCDTDARPMEGLIIPGKVLCFNYTEFIEELYGVPRENICYIHGCRRKEKGHPKEKLILGHLPGTEEEEWDKVKVKTPRFKNTYKREIFEAAVETAARNLSWYDDDTTKKCQEIIKRHQDFFDGLNDITEVIVIGHSLSKVDWDYFDEVIRRSSVQKWYFSCHSPKGLEGIETFMLRFGIDKKDVVIFMT